MKKSTPINENLITIAKAYGRLIAGNVATMFPDRWELLDGTCLFSDELEKYFNSLDSMQAAVLMQDEEFQKMFAINLQRKAQNFFYSLDITCEKRSVYYFHQLTITHWQVSFVETLKQLKRV